jgi:hypothetical protein
MDVETDSCWKTLMVPVMGMWKVYMLEQLMVELAVESTALTEAMIKLQRALKWGIR